MKPSANPSAGTPAMLERDARIPAELAGRRLDQALAELFSDYSRNRIAQWIRAGHVTVDGRTPRARDKVAGGEQVRVRAPLPREDRSVAQPIPLDVVYEDAALIVINKPPGLVVHPAAGHRDGTLVNALLHFDPALEALPRAGLVHRLDKDTSGLLLVARTLPAHKQLVRALARREIAREYEAIVVGVMAAGGTVDAPLGRDPVRRQRMRVRDDGRAAVTHFRVLERYRAHTRLQVSLETGRTHQIRAHLAHLRYPILGDPVYGGRLRLPPASGPAFVEALRGFRRQALHAVRLRFAHPASGTGIECTAPLPPDLAGLIEHLRADAAAHAGGGA